LVSWDQRFFDPIELPGRKKLVTLRDAALYITKLPKAEHDAEEWLAAMEALLLVAEHDGPTMFARIGVMWALDHSKPAAEIAPRRKRAKLRIRAELFITGDRAKTFFGLLKNQKAEIERELGYPLEWQELPEAQACRIACYLNEVDPADETDWPRQHEWLAKRLNDMHRVFSPRV
jgi:hypothetical protein